MEESGMHRENGKNDLPAPGSFALAHDAWGQLVLTDGHGQRHVGVEPVRGFPISNPEQGISICNAEGHELFWIDNLDDLPPAVRRLLEEDLARREFKPVLRRIVKVSANTEPSEWQVETDRGPTRFVVNSEDDVRRLDGHRAMVIDAQGVRYLIPDTRALDAVSRRYLERFL
jgi:hypothetical protein